MTHKGRLTPEEAADLIIEDLADRGGIGDEFALCDDEIQDEIREAWIDIIRKVAA